MTIANFYYFFKRKLNLEEFWCKSFFEEYDINFLSFLYHCNFLPFMWFKTEVKNNLNNCTIWLINCLKKLLKKIENIYYFIIWSLLFEYFFWNCRIIISLIIYCYFKIINYSIILKLYLILFSKKYFITKSRYDSMKNKNKKLSKNHL